MAATNNAVNLNAAGIVGYDGLGVFSGSTVTQDAIILGGATTDTLASVGPLANGELVIGSTGVSPVVGSLTSTDLSVTITPGPGTIDLSAAGGGGITTINGDSGSVTGATVSLLANSGSAGCGSSVSFTAASATELDFSVTDSLGNVILGQNSGNALISGYDNICLGGGNLGILTSGSYNICIGGQGPGVGLVDGTYNCVIGTGAYGNAASGNNNLIFGSPAGNNYTGSESNNILLNSSGIVGESNAIHIGDLNVVTPPTKCFMGGIDGVTVTGTAVLVSTSGQLGDVVSSREFKENIEDIGEESSRLLGLRPVRFNYKSDSSYATSYGMIAEEVEEIYPELVLYKNDKPYSIKYHEMPALLLNEMQKMVKRIDELEKQIGRKNA